MKRFKLTALCLTFGLLLSNTNVFAAEKKPTIDTSNKIEIQLPNGNTVNPTAVVNPGSSVKTEYRQIYSKAIGQNIGYLLFRFETTTGGGRTQFLPSTCTVEVHKYSRYSTYKVNVEATTWTADAVVLKVSYSQFVDNGYEYFTFTPR